MCFCLTEWKSTDTLQFFNLRIFTSVYQPLKNPQLDLILCYQMLESQRNMSPHILSQTVKHAHIVYSVITWFGNVYPSNYNLYSESKFTVFCTV